ncbi:low molecular weight protein arginine phosphatase [Bacillus sp. H-16]|uniref:low molecular weight protein arginine phosphatase n=1 Tax=Alteribacter salitolerans TaxID=2912333 RepID=UPI0019652AB5|nr:low molecular weight protein arginine phosphatase [Alteribacter salitolerans]MBM7095577.1 low molecular weight protein arginine phosphatase [Alteribacter salitolerans]
MKKVLFVCTGNTCRSPLAEKVFIEKTKSFPEQYEARSAGIHAMDGVPISEGSKAVLEDKGIEHSHQSRSLDKDLLEWADVVLTMTQEHKRRIIEHFHKDQNNVFTLNEFVHDTKEHREKKKKIDQEAAQLEIKRAQFIAENQSKVDDFLKNNDRSKQQELEEALLAEIKPHQEAIDELIKDFPSMDIADPFGGDKHTYKQTLIEIEQAIDKLVAKLKRDKE